MKKNIFGNLRKGFTLTEIIMTLTIIGIISILTIPAVMKGYREKMYSAQLKKTISQIENAAKTVMNDEHSSSFAETTAGVATYEGLDESDTEIVGPQYFLDNYFKNAKTNCFSKENPKPGDCMLTSYKTTGGTAVEMFDTYCNLTVNGASICMWNSEDGNNLIVIDINGTDVPNIIGIDVYTLNILPDGSVSSNGTDPDKCGIKNSEWGHIVDYAQGCLQKVINNKWQVKE